jgi:hypothetical protein
MMQHTGQTQTCCGLLCVYVLESASVSGALAVHVELTMLYVRCDLLIRRRPSCGLPCVYVLAAVETSALV